MSFDRLTFNVGGELGRTKAYQQNFYRAFKMSLYIDKFLFGSKRPKIVNALNVLGRSYLEQGRWNEAEKYLQEALEICGDLRPDGDYMKVGTLLNLGLLRYQQAQYTEANKILGRALEVAESV